MQTKRNLEKGFTMIEALIAIAIFLVLSAAVAKLFLTYFTLYNVQQSTIDVVHSASTLENAVHTAAMQADAIVSSRAFSGVTYTTGSTTLILRLPSITSSGDIIANTYDYELFYASSTNAYQIISLGTGSARMGGTRRLSNSISNLTFLYNNGTPSQSTSVDALVSTRGTYKNHTVDTTVRQKTHFRNL